MRLSSVYFLVTWICIIRVCVCVFYTLTSGFVINLRVDVLCERSVIVRRLDVRSSLKIESEQGAINVQSVTGGHYFIGRLMVFW